MDILEMLKIFFKKSVSEEFHFGGSLNLTSCQFDFAWVYARKFSTHTR